MKPLNLSPSFSFLIFIFYFDFYWFLFLCLHYLPLQIMRRRHQFDRHGWAVNGACRHRITGTKLSPYKCLSFPYSFFFVWSCFFFGILYLLFCIIIIMVFTLEICIDNSPHFSMSKSCNPLLCTQIVVYVSCIHVAGYITENKYIVVG